MDKKALSERDIVTKFILPALERRGWDLQSQVREEYTLATGRVIVKGRHEQARLRGKPKRADVVLFYKPNIPVAVIEVKDNNHTLGAGIQQALEYAELLDVPLAYSTNGDAFLESDLTGTAKQIEREISLHSFPSPDELWRRSCAHKQLHEAERPIAAQDWYLDMEGKQPRYYQLTAVNRAVEAIAKGESRILLVMATGTGKTYTAFQIIWRLWKAKATKRVLFLADRSILIDQARNNDFQPFGQAMTKIEHRIADKSFEIYLALYQAVSGSEEEKNIYKQFSPGFFDLVIIDECHRGSAAENSAWREILKYFASATQIGLTATPKETADVSNIDYFGEPLFTYSLKQGIEDGYLAPYKVIRIDTDKDLDGYTPGEGKRDKHGQLVKNRTYQRKDFDRTLVLEKRTELVARKVTEYLKATERDAKTIVFCEDIEHAERMRSALARENADEYLKDRRYVRKITGEDPVGRHELDDFILPSSPYPVIATTSKLLTTGVDAQTCKLIVIDQQIGSMTEFKQIIGRGTRIREDYGKMWFTIMDFRGVTRLFEDPAFDGPPEQIYEPREGDPIVPPEPSEGGADGASKGPLPPTDRSTARRGRRTKYVIDDEEVLVASENLERYGPDGKRIEGSLEGHARTTLRALFKSQDDLRRRWVTPGERAAILTELEQRGVAVGELAATLGDDYAMVDVLAYVGFSDPLLTRRERARSARVNKVLDAHRDLTRAVLEGLLSKFVDEAVEQLDAIDLLRVRPFDALGTLVELVRAFGGRPKYEKAVAALEEALYVGP
jgi:type I restriction enzyme R subunit